MATEKSLKTEADADENDVDRDIDTPGCKEERGEHAPDEDLLDRRTDADDGSTDSGRKNRDESSPRYGFERRHTSYELTISKGLLGPGGDAGCSR